MKKLFFVFNPKSGKSQIKDHLADILDIFIKAGYQVQVHVTQDRLDARNVVETYGSDAELVVCSGGDGSLNETISGLMELEQRPELGYIPAGSTNDFASSLQIPRSMTDAAFAVVEGTPHLIDIGKFCEDKYFVYVAAFGAFTEVSYQTPQIRKNLIGHQAYMLEGVKSLGSIKSYHMRFEWDDTRLEGDFIFGMVTNTISVGGFKGLVNQDIALDDGVFEVLLIRTPKTPIDFSNIVSYMFLKEEENEFVYRFKTSRLYVYSDEEIDWGLDGEFGGTRKEVMIENLHRQIKIRLDSKKLKYIKKYVEI